jgi:uncharacterized protein DUF5680
MRREGGSREAFLRFLLEAKRFTYASQGDEATVTPLIPRSKQLEHRDGDFSYRDIYVGMTRFVGQEIVFHVEEPIWSMSYAGGMTLAARDDSERRAIYAFLRVALLAGGPDRPYRGPTRMQQSPYEYMNESQGDLDAFWGMERITRNDEEVYELRYNGGFLA